MGFKGMDEMEKDSTNGGGWVKLPEDQPVTLTVIGYLGKFASKKYPDKANFRFEVADETGKRMNLDCTWRLQSQLSKLAKEFDAPFVCTITRKQEIEAVKQKDGTTKKMLVNVFKVEDTAKADTEEGVPF